MNSSDMAYMVDPPSRPVHIDCLLWIIGKELCLASPSLRCFVQIAPARLLDESPNLRHMRIEQVCELWSLKKILSEHLGEEFGRDD